MMIKDIKELELLDYGIEAIKRAKKENLTLTQYIILGIVHKLKKCIINDIVEYSRLERSTVSKAIKVLVQKKFLKEEVDKLNKTRKYIVLHRNYILHKIKHRNK